MQITLELRKTSHRDADPSGSTCLVRHWKAWHSKHTAPRRGGAYEWGVTGATGVSTTQNGFAMAAGGGLDINVGKHFAVKPLQVEYLMTQLPQLASDLNSVQNKLRYSAGIVYRFGER